MLSPRYTYQQGGQALYPLTPERHGALVQLTTKLANGNYQEEDAPCPCAAHDDEILATRDRIGIPMTTVMCRNCGIIRTNPRITDEAMTEFYANEYPHIILRVSYAKENQREYADLHRREYHRGHHVTEFLSDLLSAPSRQQTTPLLVDVGAGTGGMMKLFQEKGFDVLGCDYDPDAINYGHSQGFTISNGSANTVDVDHQADLVLLSHVLEHVTDPTQVIDDIARLMKPGGLLYIELPGVLRISANRYRNDFLRYLRFQHTYSFSLRTLTNLVTSRGFKLTKGTEWIKAAFEYQGTSPQPMKSQPQDYQRIRTHLVHTERLRPYTALYSALADSIRHNRTQLAKPLIALGLRRPTKALLKMVGIKDV